jgi:hypothetical protein
MKFDENIIDILKNFKDINESLFIEPGNVIRTMSTSKSILAKTILPVTFDKRIAIYELTKFISSIELFKNPELIFNDRYVVISENKMSINYLYADEDLINKPYDKDLVLPSIDVEFDITSDQLKGLFTAIKKLSLQQIYIIGDGTNIYMQAGSSKSNSNMTYSIELGTTDKNFKIIINNDNLKIINSDYHVQITQKRIAYFKGKTVDYYIAVDPKSTFS